MYYLYSSLLYWPKIPYVFGVHIFIIGGRSTCIGHRRTYLFTIKYPYAITLARCQLETKDKILSLDNILSMG